MRLLFDEHLSRALCERLSDIFPGSQHVCVAGLEQAADIGVWEYAKVNGLIIVTKDSDFHQLSFLQGAPPKVVWLRIGNCTTDMVEILLRRNFLRLESFESDQEATVLILESV